MVDKRIFYNFGLFLFYTVSLVTVLTYVQYNLKIHNYIRGSTLSVLSPIEWFCETLVQSSYLMPFCFICAIGMGVCIKDIFDYFSKRPSAENEIRLLKELTDLQNKFTEMYKMHSEKKKILENRLETQTQIAIYEINQKRDLLKLLKEEKTNTKNLQNSIEQLGLRYSSQHLTWESRMDQLKALVDTQKRELQDKEIEIDSLLKRLAEKPTLKTVSFTQQFPSQQTDWKSRVYRLRDLVDDQKRELQENEIEIYSLRKRLYEKPKKTVSFAQQFKHGEKDALEKKLKVYKTQMNSLQLKLETMRVAEDIVDRIKTLPNNCVLIIKDTNEVLPLNNMPTVLPLKTPSTTYEPYDQLYVVGIRYCQEFMKSKIPSQFVRKALIKSLYSLVEGYYPTFTNSIIGSRLGSPRIGRGISLALDKIGQKFAGPRASVFGNIFEEP